MKGVGKVCVCVIYVKASKFFYYEEKEIRTLRK